MFNIAVSYIQSHGTDGVSRAYWSCRQNSHQARLFCFEYGSVSVFRVGGHFCAHARRHHWLHGVHEIDQIPKPALANERHRSVKCLFVPNCSRICASADGRLGYRQNRHSFLNCIWILDWWIGKIGAGCG